VEIENNRIRRIEPNPDNRATPEGACLKGLSYVERQHTSKRLRQPHRRDSKGGFSAISWDEAIEIIGEKISRFREESGPQSILYYAGSGTKGLLNAVGLNFWRLFGGCTTTYGDLCWPAGLEATRLTLGENKHNVPWDLANARLIVIWGKNPAETNIHQTVFIDEARKAGAKVVVIDPRRTESAERADLLIQPRPGTDGALALGVAHQLIRDSQVDGQFILRFVHGYERFREYVLDFDSKYASEIAGVPVEQIEELAAWLGEIRPATINCGFGMQRYTNSGQALRAIISLLALTGNLGKPGSGWIFANLQSQIFSDEKDPIAFYPPEKPDGMVRVSISTARLGQDILDTNNPELRMIWVERGNPVTQNPDTNTVLRAFRSMDFRVVVDQFMTDTAREADIVLPAKTLFEQNDIINAYWHPYVQLKSKLLEPVGEVKPETEIYRLLAEALGVSTAAMDGQLPRSGDKAIEDYLKRQLESTKGLTLEQLRKGPVVAPGTQEIAFSDFVFPTPSGRIELYSEEAQQRWGLNPLPTFSEPVESQRSTLDEGLSHPLQLLTPNTKNRIHSQFNNLDMIRSVSSSPSLTINPEDAEARKIRAGQQVRVFNDRGELKLPAKFDYSIRPGCVSVSNGWWISDGGCVNFLSSGRETDMGYGAAFHDNLVEVEALD
jgi:anaerobic selenocysteine-containing dehydrogenase